MLFSGDELDAIELTKAGTRQIRESDISDTDFGVLIEGGRWLHSSLVIAVASCIQADSEAQGESPSFVSSHTFGFTWSDEVE